MPKLSTDEIISRHKNLCLGGDPARGIVKAAKAPTSWDPEKRKARFVMSTETRDRDSDIVKTQGIDIDQFMKNPVALWMHKSDSPVGSWSDLEKVLSGRPRRLEGDFNALPEELDQTADRVARLVDSGIVRTCSIGFMIDWNQVEYEYDEEKRLGTFLMHATELLECSIVSVPANRGALAKSSGDDRRLALEVIEDVLDNWKKLPNGVIVERSVYEDAIKALSAERTSVSVKAVEPEVSPAVEEDPVPDEAETKRRQIKEATETKRIEDTLFERMVDWAAKHFGKKAEPEPTPAPTPMTAEEKARVLADADETASKARAA
jgi:HK97 family phage prohead protease